MATKIAVLGAGSWGSALALLLANNKHDVYLWGKDAAQMDAMQQQRCNQKYLPEITFPENITCTADLTKAVEHAEYILLVIPSHAYAEFLPQLKPLLSANQAVAWTSKGFADGELLHQVITQTLGSRPLAIISGPSFAIEVAQQKPTAVVVASDDQPFAQQWLTLLGSDSFRPYLSQDVIGVEVAGAVKNVLAIATGIADGLKLGSNAQAAIITRGLAEITRLGLAMGAKAETFMGLAGVGDLVLTCTDNQSRNRRFGLALGEGKTLEQAKHSISQVIEGINTTEEVFHLAKKFNVDMPITEQVYNVLYQNLDVQIAVQQLLTRDLKAE